MFYCGHIKPDTPGRVIYVVTPCPLSRWAPLLPAPPSPDPPCRRIFNGYRRRLFRLWRFIFKLNPCLACSPLSIIFAYSSIFALTLSKYKRAASFKAEVNKCCLHPGSIFSNPCPCTIFPATLSLFFFCQYEFCYHPIFQQGGLPLSLPLVAFRIIISIAIISP